MKKSLLTLGAACLALSSFGATKYLYTQNFESATDVTETGWSFGGASISLGSDDYGKFIQLSQGQVNGRTGTVKWGQEIFMNENGECVLGDEGEYTMKFDFMYSAGSNNQYNGAITVFTNANGIANQPYVNGWSAPIYRQNYLFNMSQNDPDKAAMGYAFYPKATYTPAHTEPEEVTDEEGNLVTKDKEVAATIALDYSEAKTLDTGMWYSVILKVNTVDRYVDYTVNDVTGETVVSGTFDVPEVDYAGNPISMFAEGLWVMCARYQTTVSFDNIEISYNIAGDYANPPVIALTRVGKDANDVLDLNLRAYNITFLEDETLHVVGTDGATIEVEYADCDGKYVYETTKSGVLKAWTTSGDATSEEVTAEVECTPIVLPTASVSIAAVEEGYGKTYKLEVSNAEVPLSPTIFMSYEFKAADGTVTTGEELVSGNLVTVADAGTLTITTAAFGYQGASKTVENNLEYKTKKVYDFARMTKDEITAALPGGEWSVTNSAKTSGWDNWTARKRLYYQVAGSEHENDEGAIVMDNAYPFGFISEDNTTNVIEACIVSNNGKENADHCGTYFDGLTIFPNTKKDASTKEVLGYANVGVIYHVGLVNNETYNNNNDVIVNNLAKTDFVCINYINDYGSNSNHPTCATDDEYYAQLAGTNVVIAPTEGQVAATDAEGNVIKNENNETVYVGNGVWTATYALYRIDTAITKLTVFAQVGGDNAVETVNAVVGDNYYYTIDGLRVAQPTKAGLYIHNGKKIIVK